MTNTASWGSGERRSSSENLAADISQLVIDSVTTDEGVNDTLALLHASDTGAAGVSYLVFGLPGTGTYSLWDLNHLPSNTAVELRIYRAGRVLSYSVFNSDGMQGVQPEESSTNTGSEVPDWAFALAKTIAFGDPLDNNVQYPNSINEILKAMPEGQAQAGDGQSGESGVASRKSARPDAPGAKNQKAGSKAEAPGQDNVAPGDKVTNNDARGKNSSSRNEEVGESQPF